MRVELIGMRVEAAQLRVVERGAEAHFHELCYQLQPLGQTEEFRINRGSGPALEHPFQPGAARVRGQRTALDKLQERARVTPNLAADLIQSCTLLPGAGDLGHAKTPAELIRADK